MLPRNLEPEVMDTAEEAADYDAMDHSTVNRVFVGDFCAALIRGLTPPGSPLRVLDVGTGTALIPIELVRFVRESGDLRSGSVARSGDRPQQGDLRSGQRHGQETGRNEGQETGRNVGLSTLDSRPSTLHVTAIDLAEEMLKVGRANVARAGYGDCISLELVDAKRLPYADASFDAVISNSIVHHIPEPRGTLAGMWRVLKPGGLLFVRDLLRPETAGEVERIVATYAGDESPRQQQLFRQSLHAALTVEEVGTLLAQLGIGAGQGRPAVESVARSGNRAQLAVRQTSDRHWTVVAWR